MKGHIQSDTNRNTHTHRNTSLHKENTHIRKHPYVPNGLHRETHKLYMYVEGHIFTDAYTTENSHKHTLVFPHVRWSMRFVGISGVAYSFFSVCVYMYVLLYACICSSMCLWERLFPRAFPFAGMHIIPLGVRCLLDAYNYSEQCGLLETH